jgi:type IX secretion system PorP/SprF family membrane protein
MKQKYAPAFFVLLLAFTSTSAQQDPKKTHYMFDNLSFNPAFTGSKKNSVCATSLVHQQWYGFREPETGIRTGAVTNLFTLNGAVKNTNSGLGLNIYTDRLGFEKSVAFQASYAYHFELGATSRLGVGAAVGMMQKNLDGARYKPLDPGDPNIPIAPVSDITPDLSAGLFYSNPGFHKFYAGFSVTHVIPGSLVYTTINNNFVRYNLLRTAYLTAGATFALGPMFELEPSVLIKTDTVKTQYDINAGVWYNRVLRAAVGTSVNKGTFITLMLGYKLSNSLFVSYSWDAVTGELGKVSPSTHELFVSYCWKFKDIPPRKLENVRWL